MNYSINRFSSLLLLVNNSGDIDCVNRVYTDEEKESEQNIINEYLTRGDDFLSAVSLIENEIHKGTDAESYQTIMYDIGKRIYGKDRLRNFFGDIYVKLSEYSSSGARIGVVIDIIGTDKFIERLNQDIYLI